MKAREAWRVFDRELRRIRYTPTVRTEICRRPFQVPDFPELWLGEIRTQSIHEGRGENRILLAYDCTDYFALTTILRGRMDDSVESFGIGKVIATNEALFIYTDRRPSKHTMVHADEPVRLVEDFDTGYLIVVRLCILPGSIFREEWIRKMW